MNESESTGAGAGRSVEVKMVPPERTGHGMSPHTMGMLTHLSGLSGFIGVPFGNIVGPLICWMVKKDEMPFVDQCGKEGVNFGISMTIYLAVSFVLCFVLIGIPLFLAFLVMSIVCPIIAGLRANEGQHYEYPLTIRFIS